MNLRRALLAVALGGTLSGACGGSASDPATPTPIVTAPTRVLTATVTVEATRTAPATATATAVPATATAAATEAPTTAAPAPANPTAPAPQPTAAPQPTSAPRESTVSVTVAADALKFDRASIRVAAGATVTATLQNNEAGVAHNLSFSLPGLGHGETCTGPCSATQTFKAEKAGSYFFLCTLHDMVGSFIVDP